MYSSLIFSVTKDYIMEDYDGLQRLAWIDLVFH